MKRRDFLAGTSAICTSGLWAHSLCAQEAQTSKNETVNEICVFTKPFNSLSFDELADRIAELGFNGIEAPIRKGGHIETEQIADKLPALVEALSKRNLRCTLVTSDINDPNDKITRKFLRTLGTLQLPRYRMKYLNYDRNLDPIDQLNEWKPRMKDLASMNHEYGVQGLYQNHAGAKNFGAAIWDLREVLAGIDPGDLAVAYDIRHATVEGGTSWPVTLNVIWPHVGMIYVKDFDWIDGKIKNVPLGTGQVKKEFFKILDDKGYVGPISLHEEYLNHRDPKLVPKHLAAMKQDLATLKKWMG